MRILIILACGMFASLSQASNYDPTPAWPLCGRIAEAPPAGWLESQGCPSDRWGSAEHTDFPISSTYGPRQLVSEGYRYDYHRGIDLATPSGTPVFAIADGVVRIAGPDSAYSDPLVQLRHYRPGYSGSCTSGGGCYHSLYLHLSGWTVAAGDSVSKGQLIGYTGVSGSGFAHLHFELRDAIPEDPFSSWQRDAVHPLAVLPYDDGSPRELSLAITEVDVSNPQAPVVSLLIDQPSSDPQLDLARIDVTLYKDRGKRGLAPISQAGANPDANGYYVNPPWLDLQLRNRQYTHKNSSNFPWSSFSNCPYASEHGASYSAHVHLDKALASDAQVGDFNGIEIAPEHYNASSERYQMAVTFKQLKGIKKANKLCVKATATTLSGHSSEASWNCP